MSFDQNLIIGYIVLGALGTLFAACVIGFFRKEPDDRISDEAKKLVGEFLRAKYLARSNLGDYALNVSPSGIKVASARDHQLALLAGFYDFWELIPECSERDKVKAIAELERNLPNCERRLACIDDGHSKTFVSCAGYVIPNGYSGTGPTPEQFRDIIDHAKNKPGNGDDQGHPVED